MTTAYFDEAGRCFCTSTGALDEGVYHSSAEVPEGVRPDDIWFNGEEVMPRLPWLWEDRPSTVLLGEEIIISVPADVVIYENDVEKSSPHSLDTAASGTKALRVEGALRGEYAIEVVSLDTYRDIALARLSHLFIEKLSLGCSSPKGPVDCDDKAVARITATLSLYDHAAIPHSTTRLWTMLDKSKVAHDYYDRVSLCVAIATGFYGCFGVKQMFEDEITAAATRAEIDAIDINVGWPS
jgi:hypothetical protein